MSAANDYVNHVRNRYRINAPVAEKVRYHEQRINILQRYAAEDPSQKQWAEAEIASSQSFIRGLRSGNA